MAQCPIGSCEICETFPRIRYCIDCEQYFCKLCEKSHLKSKSCKNHKFIDSDKVDQEAKITKCESHDEKFAYFCETCSVLICNVCLTSCHRKHDFSPIEEAADKRRTALETEIKFSQVEINEVMNDIYFLESAKDKMINQAEDAQRKIEAKRVELIEMVNTESVEILKAINGQRLNECEKVDLEIARKDNAIKTIQFMQEMAQNYNSEELLTTSCDLKAVLKDLRDSKTETITSVSMTSFMPLSTQQAEIRKMFGHLHSAVLQKSMFINYSRSIRTGDHVRIKSGIERPSYGWGGVDVDSVGVVTSIHGDKVLVNFPEQEYWEGLVSEIQQCLTL